MSDARVKAARRLRKRSFRDADRAFLAEGPQAVREALAEMSDGGSSGSDGGSGARVREVFADGVAAARYADLLARAADLGLTVYRSSGKVLADLSETVTPQGIVAVCAMRHVPVPTALASRPRLVVVLAAVRDPGNAGTVLRSADAAGAGAVVFAGASVDPYNGKCVRATAGSLFHLPLAIEPDLPAAVAACRDAGLTVVAADSSTDAATTDLEAAETSGLLARPLAWLFGNEAWGLSPEVRALADHAVRIPIYGRAESLNLAAAAAVCLYATARAQQHTTGNP